MLFYVVKHLLPRETVAELDKFIIGQNDAKRAVAVALSMYNYSISFALFLFFPINPVSCLFLLVIENQLESVGIFSILLTLSSLSSFI